MRFDRPCSGSSFDADDGVCWCRLAAHKIGLAAGGQGFEQLPERALDVGVVRLPVPVEQAVQSLEEAAIV